MYDKSFQIELNFQKSSIPPLTNAISYCIFAPSKTNIKTMSKETSIKLFEEKKVRTTWDETEEKWYFSVVDVVGILTESENPRRYWSDLKIKLEKEGSQLYENIVQLKMLASDGKMRMTDVANEEQLFRIIQSIPSPKAEPFKLWMAQVATYPSRNARR